MQEDFGLIFRTLIVSSQGKKWPGNVIYFFSLTYKMLRVGSAALEL